MLGEEKVGEMGLVSAKVMNDVKIKRVNVAIFEINESMLRPLPSRTNKYTHLPEVPLVEKDISIIVDKSVTWETISKMIKSKVNELIFTEEYTGLPVPLGKKSVTFKIKLGDGQKTMTTDEINKKINDILKTLSFTCNAYLREE